MRKCKIPTVTIETENSQMQWIDVAHALPKEGVRVISCGTPLYLADYEGDNRKLCFDCVNKDGVWVSGHNVTHWMPVPELPQLL